MLPEGLGEMAETRVAHLEGCFGNIHAALLKDGTGPAQAHLPEIFEDGGAVSFPEARIELGMRHADGFGQIEKPGRILKFPFQYLPNKADPLCIVRIQGRFPR